MSDVGERPGRSTLCNCPEYGPETCGYHAVDEAEGNAMEAAIVTYMRQVGLDPDSPKNDDIRTGIGLLLEPAMDAYLDAFAATPGWTVEDLRAFLKEHPSP